MFRKRGRYRSRRRRGFRGKRYSRRIRVSRGGIRF